MLQLFHLLFSHSLLDAIARVNLILMHLNSSFILVIATEILSIMCCTVDCTCKCIRLISVS